MIVYQSHECWQYGFGVSYLSRKRNHMMFTKRKDLDVFANQKLIRVLGKHRFIHDLLDVLHVAFGEEQHGPGISFRRLEKALSVRILTDTF
jgi:hypothetical protein